MLWQLFRSYRYILAVKTWNFTSTTAHVRWLLMSKAKHDTDNSESTAADFWEKRKTHVVSSEHLIFWQTDARRNNSKEFAKNGRSGSQNVNAFNFPFYTITRSPRFQRSLMTATFVSVTRTQAGRHSGPIGDWFELGARNIPDCLGLDGAVRPSEKEVIKLFK